MIGRMKGNCHRFTPYWIGIAVRASNNNCAGASICTIDQDIFAGKIFRLLSFHVV